MRLQSVQDALRADVLDRETCIEILSGCLNPEDHSSKIDDSALLDDPDSTKKLETTCPACYRPLGGFLTETWTRMSMAIETTCPGCEAVLDVRVRQFVKFEIKARYGVVSSR